MEQALACVYWIALLPIIMKNKPKSLRCVSDLVEADLISGKDSDDYKKIEASYDIGITPHVRALINEEKLKASDCELHDSMRPQDNNIGLAQDSHSRNDNRYNDPIGRQYIPNLAELNICADENTDPIGDDAHSPVKGIVHRYPDRALLKITNICAVYCRYCFRRDIIGAGSDHLISDDYAEAINYIKSHKEIWEVILTGGDPLILSAGKLQIIMDDLCTIDHVKVIRVHTRIPVANPDIIDNTILSVLESVTKSVYIVLHVNHAKEITEKSEDKILQLRRVNCSILSQSVLLNGVNDDAKTLERLFKKLIGMHVKPYYLHHLDRAKGTSHFRVSLARGRKIMKELQGGGIWNMPSKIYARYS